MELYTAMKTRRSRYDLTNKSTISDERIKEVLKDAINYTPSAFNSQSSRVLLLLGDRHKKLWDITADTLRKIVPADAFASTQSKLDGFAGAYGTILFFEDMSVVEGLQEKFALYADNFPIWSNQSAGMLQYSVWTSLANEGLGANLQHYNPLIDETVLKEFNLPSTWRLMAQMPFGVATGEVGEAVYQPIDERFFTQGEGKQ